MQAKEVQVREVQARDVHAEEVQAREVLAREVRAKEVDNREQEVDQDTIHPIKAIKIRINHVKMPVSKASISRK